MTDNEIIKAFEHCHEGRDCRCCAYYGVFDCSRRVWLDVAAIINRQKSEIERLEKESISKEKAYNNEYCLRKKIKDEFKDYKAENGRLLQKLQQAKSEAIKEFAERLKSEYEDEKQGRYIDWLMSDIIDNLVKEMTEVKENA